MAKSEQVAAVLRPHGPGPFPLLIVLGGTLTDASVELAARLATAGFVALAGCWQLKTVPPYTMQLYERKATVIACPRLLADERDALAALIAVGRKQPGVRTDAVGLYGASAGGNAALEVIAARRDIRAAVLDSPDLLLGTFPEAATINTPILVLAGTADTYGDFTAQKNYVEALQHAGKDVEWHYYEGGRHVLLNDPAYKDDATRRTIDYLIRRLMAGA